MDFNSSGEICSYRETLLADVKPISIQNNFKIRTPGAEVQRIIELTEALDTTFVSNMKEDWSTSWQFFAHHTGMMRQYPGKRFDQCYPSPKHQKLRHQLPVVASKWNRMYFDDYFDARFRPWYLRAATSPKDVIILLDNSASIFMTEPKKLTKLVAHTILDTLTPDDFVSVLLYTKDVSPLLPGLNLTLIPVRVQPFPRVVVFSRRLRFEQRLILFQATSANVRELQFALEGVKPHGTANMSLALNTTFELLERVSECVMHSSGFRARAPLAACARRRPEVLRVLRSPSALVCSTAGRK